MKENRKESKVVICPGAIYNEYVEHQNIFGVMNVYPSDRGEAGQKSQSMAPVGQIGKPSHKGRNSEHLFALDDACYCKDEVETRQQVSLFCRFLKQNEMQGEPISAKVDSPLNIAIFSFVRHWKKLGVIPPKRVVGVNTIFRFLSEDCRISNYATGNLSIMPSMVENRNRMPISSGKLMLFSKKTCLMIDAFFEK